MSNMKIGWSEISITPDKKVALAGQFAERISQYIEKPLTATAMAFSDGVHSAVLVTLTLCSVPEVLYKRVEKTLFIIGK